MQTFLYFFASTHVHVGKDACVAEIIDTHLSFMLDHDVAVHVPADNEKLPSFYWSPKLHVHTL